MKWIGLVAGGPSLIVLAGCRPAVPPAHATAPQPVVVAAKPAPPSTRSDRPVDSDGDGKPDDLDLCPDEPATPDARGARRDDGCRHGGIAKPPPDWPRIQFVEWIWFRQDDTVIAPDALMVLDGLAKTWGAASGVTSIEVVGHAAAWEHGKLELAKARAESVVDALVARGMDRARLTSRPDPTLPALPRSDDPRVQGRRVSLQIMKTTTGARDPRTGDWHFTPACRTEQPLPQTIEFLRGSDGLEAQKAAALDELAAFLQQHPEAGVAKLIPSVGTDEFPAITDQTMISSGLGERRALAGRRARVARDALIARGVPASRLVRRIPIFAMPGAHRDVQVVVILPNPDRDAYATGCIDGT